MPATLSGFSTGLLTFFCLGCSHLYVQQESIDGSYLASAHVDTPDPKRDNPPTGQKILISWDFPKSLFDEGLTALAAVRLWDNEQVLYKIPIERKRDVAELFFPSTNRILTYRIQVVDEQGEIVETWNHQFWTELIQIDETKSSVSSQPRQGSVIETP